MPDINTHWRTDRPGEGFYTTLLPTHPDRPVRTFLPSDYQPRYPYPLVVLLHRHGGNEEQVARLAPRLSRRNFIAISLRGPQELGRHAGGWAAFGWGPAAAADSIEDYLLAAVEQTRRVYHVHSERVYLAGVGEGAEVAYRVGLGLADRVAGVIALNGQMPRPAGSPLFRFSAVRNLPVLIGHGTDNAVVPYAAAQRDYRLLYAAGANVRLVGYPTTHKLHPDMLRDVNRWIIGRVNAAATEVVNIRR
ncbi:MAG TPA: dienelactone hydrolase family protein [Gemmataceae bacterium]|nr:dienelactone hydrolase family protein [Gemmataceae bacterium]